ncbi:alpha-hydroxy acid oxidase, partial [Sphingopyxis sp.]|uniref:alpha-hydroxy acid oxidase n=1 Tax=Sphingopyxis sp. TaxID=1908224 RepID=UPI002EDB8E53
AKRRLPWPVFDYIDGAADDEVTRRRNREAFDDCDLIPRVLAGVASVDMKTTLFGREMAMPLFLSPTALQRLFHWQGERAVLRAAANAGTVAGISSLATISLAEAGALTDGPKLFQLYVHHDEGLNQAMLDAARDAKFDAVALTVDTIVGGNRERCLRSGFTSPPRFTASNMLSYAAKPGWGLNYVLREKFSLPNLATHVSEGSSVPKSVAEYFTSMLDQSLDWKRAEAIRRKWDGPFCLKGIVAVEDAKRAADIGATAIMVSNHGGRQLDGSISPFDALAEIVDAVGDRVEVICDGGITRGTHVLKALSVGARACSGGRLYLYALAAAGEDGVARAIALLRAEMERGMKLMGARTLADLGPHNLRWR